MKKLIYNDRERSFSSPEDMEFESEFFEFIYCEIYSRITDGENYQPVWDVDEINASEIRDKIIELAQDSGEKIQKPSKKATNKERSVTQHHIRYFLQKYPEMSGLFLNTISLAEQNIRNAEFLLGESCSGETFIQLKQIIDEQNRRTWNRDRDTTESQSGVSTLGTVSETLLKLVFAELVDDTNFFKVDTSEVQTYGDFVLICLPNNLWVSVKSNFARERLLASGYTTDIIGVGFFESADEFTGQVRIRNFQRAGFLAMYCPDIAVKQTQIDEGTTTYDLILKHHEENGTDIPNNINGQPFIRPLSNLKADLMGLLDQDDIRKRITVHF